MRALVILASLALALPSVAQAAWSRAETDRFIVYGDARPETVRDYAIKLSVFDAVLRTYNPAAAKAAPGQKLEIYVVSDHSLMRRANPDIADAIGGYYTAGPQATYAIAVSGRGSVVLFHEYTHHFMRANFPAAYPGWFTEGWAEYFSTAEISGKEVRVGQLDPSRVARLSHSEWLPLKELLAKSPLEMVGDRSFTYYAQAWLLTHYMQATKERADQLNKALADIAAGADPVKAVEVAAGTDLDALTRRLQRYTKISVSIWPLAKAPPAPVVSALSPGEAAFILDRLRVANLTPGDDEARYLTDLRKRAAAFPGDRYAELTLAQAEFAVGDVAAAEAIVAQRLKVQPDDGEALTIAALGELSAAARRPAERPQRARAARPYAMKAYQLDDTNYRALFAYARSRTVEPAFPTENDLNALREAGGLAPSVKDISLMTGRALLRRNHDAEARNVLALVANDPHGGKRAAEAKALLSGRPLADVAVTTGEEADTPPTQPPAQP